MQRARTHRRITTWLAAFAVLLMSLAPAISHAVLGPSDAGWIEICTTRGAQWLNGSGDAGERTPAPQPTTLHLLEHCPYCSLHATMAGAPAAPAVLALPTLEFEAPRPFLEAPRILHAWLAAEARAPPAFS